MGNPDPQILRRLVARYGLRRRLRRFFDTLAIAALPALALSSVAMLLAKRGWLSGGEWSGIALVLGVLALIPALIAALWPVSPLEALVRIDRANDTGDALSSAYDFLARPDAERTPEMRLHVERALARAGQVRVAPAQPLRLPPEVWPALGLVALLVVIGLLREPEHPPLVPISYPEPAPEIIVDTGRLLEDARNIEALRELAERSGDDDLQEVARELDRLVTELQRGTISEEELLDRLAALDERIAASEAPPEERIDLDPLWERIAPQAQEAIEGLGLPEESALREEAEALLEAIEEGDEDAIADAIEQLDDMLDALDSEELDPDELSALADLLEDFADLIDPTDPALRELWERYRDQIGEYESRLAERERSRDRRGLEQAREGLADAAQQMADAEADRSRSEQTQADVSDALGEAAQQLRERAQQQQAGANPEEAGPPEAGEGAQAEEQERPDADGGGAPEEGNETGAPEEREATAGEEADEQRGSHTEGVAPEEGQEPAQGADQEPGQAQQPPGGDSEREAQEGTTGENATRDDGEGEGGQAEEQRGDSGSGEGQAGQEGAEQPEQETPLDRAADSLRQSGREQAQEEARERAERATQDLRENLQRSSGREMNAERDESQWQEFVERAGGEEVEGNTGGDEGDPTLHGDEGRPPEGGQAPEQAVAGEEDGGDPLGDEETNLGGRREGAGESGLAQGDEGPATPAEVFEAAATSGFASREYQDIYVEYQRAAEAALEAEEIPRGYAHFVRRYLELIEPRVPR
jgi:hypothetical protein